jgi:LEA14-like dessication related protein
MEECKEKLRVHPRDLLPVSGSARCLLFSAAILIFLIITGSLISGCASLGKRLVPLNVSVSNIQPVEIKAFESIFQLDLRVFNTNETPVTVRGIDCELEINGSRFALGVSNEEKTIPSFGTETIPVRVYSSFLDVFKGVVGLKNKEYVQYKLKGKIRIKSNHLLPLSIPFISEGNLSPDRLID